MRKAVAEEKIRRLAKKLGTVRPRDVERLGVARMNLYRLREEGRLTRVARGLYALADWEPAEYRTFAEACSQVPNGVVCLLSALRFHGLTTQSPHQLWMAIARGTWKPNVPELPLRFVRFSGEAFSAGIDEHVVSGVTVKVYCPAKTVAECFKYRNKIGLDVALEALRDAWRKRQATMDDLWKYGRICRVANVMRPYMESLV